MLHHDKVYMEGLERVLDQGRKVDTRNAVCVKDNGYLAEYDLREGFPLLLSKKVFDRSVLKELTWFNRGETNINTLGCGIWDKWCDENGYCGPIYGQQWAAQVHIKVIRDRDYDEYLKANYKPFGFTMLTIEQVTEQFGTDINLDMESEHPDCVGVVQVVDPDGVERTEYEFPTVRIEINQVEAAIERLRNHPGDRRAVVSAWNPGDIPFMKLPPCHMLYVLMTLPMTVKERREHYLLEKALNDSGKNFVSRKMANVTLDKYLKGRSASGLREEEYLNSLDVPKFYLDLAWVQRSVDKPVGEPFNIASYAAQLTVCAAQLNMAPRKLFHFQCDLHIYSDQLKFIPQQLAQMEELEAIPDMQKPHYPRLRLKRKHDKVADYTWEDLEIVGYTPKGYVPYPVTE